MNAYAAVLIAAGGLATAMPARASDPCPQLRLQVSAPDVATRIAAFACQENHAWFRTFIDADGRFSGQPVYEAESLALADGTLAWRKVAAYWNGSGLSGECAILATTCRNFIVDTPWSAAFVSWVMRRAGVHGFPASARHLDYLRASRRSPSYSPHRLVAPQLAVPAPGDLLCYVRGTARMLGHEGLVERMDNDVGLAMHCEIVVAAVPGEMAWLVGGNVQQAVTLRMLRLDAQGRFANLPLRDASDMPCSPDAPANCNLNRQDWVALLKLNFDATEAEPMPTATIP